MGYKQRHLKPADPSIPDKFVPKFFADLDSRLAIKKEITHRLHRLKSDTGCDSYQKEILAQRAVFVALQLETIEVEAAEGQKFDIGSYTQSVNCLIGLLRVLGIPKSRMQGTNLKAYLKEQRSA